MNILNTFLKAGLSQSMPIIGGEVATWGSIELDVIYHETFNEMDFATGGYNPSGDKVVIFIPIASFPDATRPVAKELITIKGKQWRIDNINEGDIRLEVMLINKDRRT